MLLEFEILGGTDRQRAEIKAYCDEVLRLIESRDGHVASTLKALPDTNPAHAHLLTTTIFWVIASGFRNGRSPGEVEGRLEALAIEGQRQELLEAVPDSAMIH